MSGSTGCLLCQQLQGKHLQKHIKTCPNKYSSCTHCYKRVADNDEPPTQPETDIVDGTQEDEHLFTCVPCNKWFYAPSDFVTHLKSHSKSNQEMDITGISPIGRTPSPINITPSFQINIAPTVRTLTPFTDIAPWVTATPINIAPIVKMPARITNIARKSGTTPIDVAPKVRTTTPVNIAPAVAAVNIMPTAKMPTFSNIAPKVITPTAVNIAPKLTTITPVNSIAPIGNMTTPVDIIPTFGTSNPITIAPMAAPITITPTVRTTIPKPRIRRRTLYKCSECGVSCNGLVALQEHIKLHTREQEASYKCALCGLCLSSQVFLTYHLMSQHAGYTHRGASVRNQVPRHHTGNKQTPQTSTTPRVQAVRTRCRYPAQRRRHNCQHCGFGFSTAGGLTAHTVIHTGRDYSSCRTCVEGFLHEADLEKHLARHVITPAFIFDTRQVS